MLRTYGSSPSPTTSCSTLSSIYPRPITLSASPVFAASFCECLPFSSATLVDGDCDCLNIGPIKKRGNTCGKVLRPLKGLSEKPPMMRVWDDGGGNPVLLQRAQKSSSSGKPAVLHVSDGTSPTVSVGNDLNLNPARGESATAEPIPEKSRVNSSPGC